MIQNGKSYAPWTAEETAALNKFQSLGNVHPFTCPTNHKNESRVLIAHQDGWHCPSCSYRQDWAHPQMVQIGFNAAVNDSGIA